MHTVTATLESLSPYSQSRYHGTPKNDKETAQDHEERTWRERMHTLEDGTVFMPPMAFKGALSEAAKFLCIQIPGRGKANYTKHFDAGVLVTDPLVLPIKKNDVPGEWLYLNADGKRGGGTRVLRCMPKIESWMGEVTYHVLDDTITETVFRRVLDESGNFIGVGRFRPRNGGFYGRYAVTKFSWK